MQEQIFYILKLKEQLSLRQKKNPLYSLRAFSNDLGLHSATLSQILTGKRNIPLKKVNSVIDKLSLSPKEKSLFLESFYKTKIKIDGIKIDQDQERFVLDESHYRIIAEWEHYAILDLFDLSNCKVSIEEIVSRLAISKTRAEVVLNNLIQGGLVSYFNGYLKKTHSNVETSDGIKSQALIEAHKEAMEIGAKKIDEIDIDFRNFSSSTFAVDLEKLPEAYAIIKQFRQKMSALLKDGNKTEIFQLAIQLYPLSNMNNEKENKNV